MIDSDETHDEPAPADGGRMQAVQLMPGEHHWRHGITFKRLHLRLGPKEGQKDEGNGDVQLCVGGLIFRIPAAEWISILAETSASGSYAQARFFHMETEPWRQHELHCPQHPDIAICICKEENDASSPS